MSVDVRSVRWLMGAGALALSVAAACSAGSDAQSYKPSQFGQGGAGLAGSGGGIASGGSAGMAGGAVLPNVTLTGRVMAPNGAFPISGALVYFTLSDPQPIPTGVFHYECDKMEGTPYTLSKADGTWTIENVPVGKWKLVTRKGNFRRIREIELSEGMDTAIPEETTTLPGSSTQDGLDVVPTFAVVRTDPDLTYNLLAKFGMGSVNSSGSLIDGTESFDIYEDGSAGSNPAMKSLFENDTLKNYHMIFLPCYATAPGVAFVNNNVQLLRDYVSAGGRIYNSCTVSLWTEAPFPDYIDYYQDDTPDHFDIGRRTNSAYQTKGTLLDQSLSDWMAVVSPGDPANIPFQNGYVTIDATQEVNDGHGLEKDGFVVKPQTWVKDNSSYPGSPLMVTYNYDYGKVFYSVYETSQQSKNLTPQEYVLIYVILEVGVCSNLPPPPK